MNFDATRMLSFDLETTSVNPKEARIVTSALVRIDGRDVDKREMLADPGVEIPEAAAKIHGITTEKARAEGQPHDEVLAETLRSIRQAWDDGLTLIVYNAAYDLSVLRALTGDFTVDGPVFDPFVIDRVKDKWRKGKRTLGDVSAHYGVTLEKRSRSNLGRTRRSSHRLDAGASALPRTGPNGHHRAHGVPGRRVVQGPRVLQEVLGRPR